MLQNQTSIRPIASWGAIGGTSRDQDQGIYRSHGGTGPISNGDWEISVFVQAKATPDQHDHQHQHD